MHTFNAPGGTVFHVNGDGSGDAVMSRNGKPRWTDGVSAHVPAADLLAFADWLRKQSSPRAYTAVTDDAGRWSVDIVIGDDSRTIARDMTEDAADALAKSVGDALRILGGGNG